MADSHSQKNFIAVTIAGKTLTVPPGTNLLTIARMAGVELCSACYGNALCAGCVVKILEGAENLSPMDDGEFLALKAHGYPIKLIEKDFPELRLSCQTFAYHSVRFVKINS